LQIIVRNFRPEIKLLSQIFLLKSTLKNIGPKSGYKRAQVEDRTEVSETIHVRSKAGIIPGGKTRSKINETW
jgi:hypothetical protein